MIVRSSVRLRLVDAYTAYINSLADAIHDMETSIQYCEDLIAEAEAQKADYEEDVRTLQGEMREAEAALASLEEEHDDNQ